MAWKKIMHKAVRFRPVDLWPEERPPLSIAAWRDRLWLQFARVAVVLMLSLTGFLVSAYLDSLHGTLDGMEASIEKLAENQARLAVATARIEETVRHIERRLDRRPPFQPQP